MNVSVLYVWYKFIVLCTISWIELHLVLLPLHLLNQQHIGSVWKSIDKKVFPKNISVKVHRQLCRLLITRNTQKLSKVFCIYGIVVFVNWLLHGIKLVSHVLLFIRRNCASMPNYWFISFVWNISVFL